MTEENREKNQLEEAAGTEYCVGMFRISSRGNCDIMELQFVFDHCFLHNSIV